MIQAVPDILARIVERKRAAVGALARERDSLDRQAREAVAARRDFEAALASRETAIIAEMKRASPSRGVLKADLDPARIAATYETAGAAALSVLTDEQDFQGSLDDLRRARKATAIPALRKDFTVAAEHVLEAAANGADAILLIAAILTERELRDFRELAASYSMAALVEVHDAEEVRRAVASGAKIVGVNNRDLRTFEVTLETSLGLAEQLPDGVLRVAESGIHSRRDVERLREAGYRAFLIGERFMTAPDPAAALRELIA